MRAEVYTSERGPEWDEFVRASKNGTFLFLRGYMDYHRHRFTDESLMIRDDDGRLLALLPASRHGATVASHRGLTYGGFVTDATMKTPRMLELFECVLAFLKGRGVAALEYKTIPHIYHRLPAEEDRYALFLANASVTRRALLTVVRADERPVPQERRLRGARRARQHGLSVGPSSDLAAYWQVVTDRLRASHDTTPVHTLREIQALYERFPEHMKLFACRTPEGEMVAGVLVYESARVAHCQYVAASDRGLEMQALDLLFTELLGGEYATKPYFDFGTSDEEDGRALKQGLVEQKEGFGARAVVHDHYRIDLERFSAGALVKALS